MHLTASSSTILLKGSDIKAYLDSLVQGEGVKIVDFAELKSDAPVPAAAKADKIPPPHLACVSR